MPGRGGISDSQNEFMEGIGESIPLIMKRHRQFDRQTAERRARQNQTPETPRSPQPEGTGPRGEGRV